MNDWDYVKPVKTPAKVPCPVCGKLVKDTGLYDHVKTKHPERCKEPFQ